MSKAKSRKKAAMLIVFIFLLTTGVLYHIYDNNRFVIVEQNIIIDGLPEEFNGYRILQLSDLHGKYFGEKQSNLLGFREGLHSMHHKRQRDEPLSARPFSPFFPSAVFYSLFRWILPLTVLGRLSRKTTMRGYL